MMKNDQISELFDDILIKILSSLNFKEAVRTSVISRRWQHLWKYTSCLSFDQSESRNECIKGFNKSLNAHQAWIIDEFRVRVDLDMDSKNYVDEWVGMALQKNVKRLELNFAPDLACWDFIFSHKNKDDVYYCLTKETFYFGLSGIQFLTSLSLVYIGISDEILEYIVLSCPVLESLDVSYSSYFRHPRVYAGSLKLLRLYFCDYAIRSIEIYAPNLVSFEYVGTDIAVHILFAPKLDRLSYCCDWSYGYPNLSSKLANYLPKLVSLSIGAAVVEALLLPELTNLKHLRCEAFAPFSNPIQILTSLIEKAPFLHKFELEFGPVRRYRLDYIMKFELREMWTRAKRCPNKYIKEVEIIGCPADETHAFILIYLLKNAITLETIRIDTSRACIEMRCFNALDRSSHFTYRKATKSVVDFIIEELIQNRPKPQFLLS